jgi:hypothetical protein
LAQTWREAHFIDILTLRFVGEKEKRSQGGQTPLYLFSSFVSYETHIALAIGLALRAGSRNEPQLNLHQNAAGLWAVVFAGRGRFGHGANRWLATIGAGRVGIGAFVAVFVVRKRRACGNTKQRCSKCQFESLISHPHGPYYCPGKSCQKMNRPPYPKWWALTGSNR